MAKPSPTRGDAGVVAEQIPRGVPIEDRVSSAAADAALETSVLIPARHPEWRALRRRRTARGVVDAGSDDPRVLAEQRVDEAATDPARAARHDRDVVGHVTHESSAPLRLILILPPFTTAKIVGRGDDCDVLTEIVGCRADLVGNRTRCLDIEAVAAGRSASCWGLGCAVDATRESRKPSRQSTGHVWVVVS